MGFVIIKVKEPAMLKKHSEMSVEKIKPKGNGQVKTDFSCISFF